MIGDCWQRSEDYEGYIVALEILLLWHSSTTTQKSS